MSISSALNNALSGLSAAGRSAGVVSNNIANAATDGYGRREVELTARRDVTGGGVRVANVTRLVDQTVLTDRRAADAGLARAETQVAFLRTVQNVIGEPGSALSLDGAIVELETTLAGAAERPESVSRLNQVVDVMEQLTDRMRDISDVIQRERTRADGEIATTVDQLNRDLARLEELNNDIRRETILGQEPSALHDERQRVIDRISEIVPVREIDRPNGAVALLSEGGLLLDGPAPVIAFTPTPSIDASRTLAGGQLSGITFNGSPVDMTRARSVLSGGTLDGLFAVRDELGVTAQAQMDGLARDLMERFESVAADPNILPGQPGLLTDQQLAFDPLNEVGLAARLEVNDAVNPDTAGDVTLLRDGIYRVVPGPEGDATGLQRLTGVLSALQAPASASFSVGQRDAAGLAAEVMTALGAVRDIAESDAAFSRARSEALDDELRRNGVDTDSEMQKLLMIEQAYAANARVVQTAEAMLDILMEL